MSTLSWNCRGLGLPRTVQVLSELVKHKKPSFIFLMETLSCRAPLENLKNKLGYEGLFVVDRVGQSGGLTLFWQSQFKVKLLKYGRTFIDVEVLSSEMGVWRVTCYYGYLESSRRCDSWNLLRRLASFSTLPWVCLGDFNDLLDSSKKNGSRPHAF